jgi:cell volume regulation protein A
MFPLLVQQMVLGAAIGFFLGRVLIFLYRRLKLEIEGLYLVFSIAAVMLIYSITQTLKGNGFLAVYIAGVVLGNDQFVLKKSLTLMHDGISWLMQSAMFLTLGLLIYPSKILNVAEPGILIAIFMILMARPLSVFLSLSFSKTSTREKALISWVGLRGSVPVIMATYPLVAGIDRAGLIFNIVFFVALSSLIIQGTSIHLVSKFLGVYDPHGIVNMNFSSIPGSLKEIVTIDIPLHSPVIGKSLVELHLPLKNILVVAIERKGEVIIPRGGSILREDDKLSLMADDEALADFMEIVWSKHSKIKTMFFWLPDMDK